jgi:hypothetical protein
MKLQAVLYGITKLYFSSVYLYSWDEIYYRNNCVLEFRLT